MDNYDDIDKIADEMAEDIDFGLTPISSSSKPTIELHPRRTNLADLDYDTPNSTPTILNRHGKPTKSVTLLELKDNQRIVKKRPIRKTRRSSESKQTKPVMFGHGDRHLEV